MNYFLQIIWKTISPNKITDFMGPVRLINSLPTSVTEHDIDETLCKIKELNNFDITDQSRDTDKPCVVTHKFKIHIKKSKVDTPITDQNANNDLLQQKAASLALLAGNPNKDVVSKLQNLCDDLTNVPIGHCSYTTETSTLQFQLYCASNVLLVVQKLHES